MAETLTTFFIWYQAFMLFYFIGLNSCYTFFTIFSYMSVKRAAHVMLDNSSLASLAETANMRPISIVIPAYNEELNIAATVLAAIRIKYPKYEVIVVNDGSSDNTLECLQKEFSLVEIRRPANKGIHTKAVNAVYVSKQYPFLWVIDKVSGGKADALNVGLTYSRYPLFCAVDADSFLEPDAILRIGREFLMDKTLVAVGGSVRVLNGCKVENSLVTKIKAPGKIMENIQIAEYLRGFMVGRVAWGECNSLLIISGAFGVFRKDLLLAIGGYRKTVGEDMDVVLRLHRYCAEQKIKYKIFFVHEPVCWTQVPSDIRSLLQQRNRWQRGLFDSLWHNRIMLFNPKYGRAGMVGMPFFLFVELLGPLIETAGYCLLVVFCMLHKVSPQFALLLFGVVILWGVWLNAFVVLLDDYVVHKYPKIGDSYKVALLGALEYFGYRQIIAVERLIGTFQVWKNHWGQIKRKGASALIAEAPP